MDVEKNACSLVMHAVRSGLIASEDRSWAYNRILRIVGEMGGEPCWEQAEPADTFELEQCVEELAWEAIGNDMDEDAPSGRDRIATEMMGELMPRPSAIVARFDELLDISPTAATDWFYRLCCDARYVREAAIARNRCWTTSTRWGELEITINLSKPEKDPVAIAAARRASAGAAYPACQLCMENEGYYGRGALAAGGSYPARQNLRIVPVELAGEMWGLQYSPYAYFEEHCIAMSPEHRPMRVNRRNVARLFDFVDIFPHYFIGSNADLPIVGGSILAHDHFQGGRHEFPMMRAAVETSCAMPGFDGVELEVLRWPMSVFRLRGRSRAKLLDAACHVAEAWAGYDDASAFVVSHTANGERHNTVTPVVRRVGDDYEVYLALRCNITSEEHPLGVFHPHEDKWHIKRENIGLIEVMGLAILPPRLIGELDAVKGHLLAADYDGLETDELSAPHAVWAREMAARHPELDSANAQAILYDEVGQVFASVLEDAGVFGWDEAGRAAQARFIETL